MSSEKWMIHQDKASPSTSREERSDLDQWEQQDTGLSASDQRKSRSTRKADDLFLDYLKIENTTLREEKISLNILKIFIELFCLRKRIPLKDLIEGIERMIIVGVLSHFHWSQKKAAAFLGVKYTTLNEKIKRYNIRIKKKA